MRGVAVEKQNNALTLIKAAFKHVLQRERHMVCYKRGWGVCFKHPPSEVNHMAGRSFLPKQCPHYLPVVHFSLVGSSFFLCSASCLLLQGAQLVKCVGFGDVLWVSGSVLILWIARKLPFVSRMFVLWTRAGIVIILFVLSILSIWTVYQSDQQPQVGI